MTMKDISRLWLRFIRWAFRVCGGYHKTEHAEIVWAAEVLAEKETAELRLYKHNMEPRYAMMTKWLNRELMAFDHSKILNK